MAESGRRVAMSGCGSSGLQPARDRRANESPRNPRPRAGSTRSAAAAPGLQVAAFDVGLARVDVPRQQWPIPLFGGPSPDVGVPPIAGLYTAVIAGGIAAAFGGSRFNITGPTAALVPVLSHAVVIHGPKALPLLGLMAGVMLLVMSALRAGRLVRYIPGTVVVGFTAGIALSIAFGQLNNLLNITGTDASLEHFHARVWDSARHLETVGFTTPAIGALALAILVVWPRLPRARAIPGPLIVVVVTTALTWYFGLDVPTVESKYGAIPQELPSFDAGLTK